MAKNIFVVGLNEFNLQRLERIENAREYRFHQLLGLDEVQGARQFPVNEWLGRAEDQLRSFRGSIDAIIGFWDFPISTMVPILAQNFGTRSPSLHSAVKCEHKYWSRIEQSRVIGDHVPRFSDVDPFCDNPLSQVNLDFPFWLKPVKAFSSQLGFLIEGPEQFDAAIAKIRKSIGRFAEPFDEILARLELPDEISGICGHHCMAESIIAGRQCTQSGYVERKVPHTYGVVDSISYPGTHSFFEYHYPSRLNESIKERIARIGEKIMAHMGFDNSPFNIEYYYDEAADKLWLLEINTRISQSHSYLFEKVDGVSNHQLLVELALGEPATFPQRQGPYSCAGKFHVRSFKDGVVTRTPSEQEFRQIRERCPDAIVIPLVKSGERLSELPDQDSYSYWLAVIYLGAKDDESLLADYRECARLLDYRVDDRPVPIETVE